MARSTSTCPVCGLGYRGRLVDHLDKPIAGEWRGDFPKPWMAEASRCDWNLNTFRLQRDAERMVAAGFVRAGSVARVVTPLAHTHPHLVAFAATGIPHQVASPSLIGRDHDLKVWWCRVWVHAIASFDGRMVMRRAIITDVDRLPEAQRVIEATVTLAGPHAVRALVPDVIPERCLAPYGYRTHLPADVDTCLLAKGHAGDHVGVRGSKWPRW